MSGYFPWLDTDGNIINASDGGMIYVNGKYYWYGMALRPLPVASKGQGGQTTTVGVVMYSSTDLYNWSYEGVILPCSTDPDNDLYGPMRFERPKIIYNDSTKKFVLWCHYVKYPGDHTFDTGDPFADDLTGTSFESQSTDIFSVEGKPDQFIYMAERHNVKNFEQCSYIWLPVEFTTDNRAQLNYYKTWKL